MTNKVPTAIKIDRPTVMTIGTFDGVHIGHQKILQRLVNQARQHNWHSLVLSFFPHPRMVLQNDSNIKLLNTIKEREELLRQYGLDHLIVKEFTTEFSNMSAKDFVKNLVVDELKAKKIIIGYDHHFGKNRSANIEDLKVFGKDYGFDVEEIEAQDIKDVAVSSTKIRSALQDGLIDVANSYLGYNYMLTGMVIQGKGLGRKMDFPTANIHIAEDYKLIPKNGVYVVKSTINGAIHFGMMNIGTNPTVDGSKQSIETHFFNLSDDLYARELKIELLKRLRDEVKFDGIESLKSQLKKDREQAISYVESHE